MAQIAVRQGLPVVAYSAKGMDYNDLSDICYSEKFQTYTEAKAFCNEIHRLASNQTYYRQYADSFHYEEQSEIAKFRNTLKNIMSGTYVLPEITRYRNIQTIGRRMAKLYCDADNAYTHTYPSTIKYYNHLLEIEENKARKKKMKDWFIRKIAALQKQAEEYRKEQNWKMVSGRFLSIGANAHVVHPYYIYGQWNIAVGKKFSAGPNFWMEAIDRYGAQQFTPKITIGNNVSLQRNCHIGAIDSITIGNDVLMGSNILITDHSHGETSKKLLELHPSLRPLSSKGPVVIGDRVWIGDNVVILPGVTLGEGCVVGAGAVVTKSFSAYSMIGGNTAKLIRIIE